MKLINKYITRDARYLVIITLRYYYIVGLHKKSISFGGGLVQYMYNIRVTFCIGFEGP